MTTTDPRDLEQLLPFYINGTLTGPERAELEAALATDAKLRGEAEYLRSLREKIKHNAKVSAGDLPLRRVQKQIARERKTTLAPHWWRPALAAAALVIVIQSGVLVQTFTTAPKYEPLSAPSPAQFSVRFAPGASASAIQALLEEIDAQIIAGPIGPGFYELRIKTKDPNDQQLGYILQQLKSNPDIISHAQRK